MLTSLSCIMFRVRVLLSDSLSMGLCLCLPDGVERIFDPIGHGRRGFALRGGGTRARDWTHVQQALGAIMWTTAMNHAHGHESWRAFKGQ